MPSSHPIGVNLISVSGNMSDLYDVYKGMRIYYHSKGLETMATMVSASSLNTMSTAWSMWSVCTMYIACTMCVMSAMVINNTLNLI